MSKIHQMTETLWAFWCPGCDHAHAVSDTWTFNGDFERPTIQPSVLAYAHQSLIDHNLPYGDSPGQLLAPENKMMTPQCHSFVTDGRIQFLADSTHQYAGQTVDLPDWPLGD